MPWKVLFLRFWKEVSFTKLFFLLMKILKEIFCGKNSFNLETKLFVWIKKTMNSIFNCLDKFYSKKKTTKGLKQEKNIWLWQLFSEVSDSIETEFSEGLTKKKWAQRAENHLKKLKAQSEILFFKLICSTNSLRKLKLNSTLKYDLL